MLIRAQICCLLFAHSIFTAAQDTAKVSTSTPQQEAPYTLHVQTNSVVLDVVVTDNNGNAVSSLTKEDFTILEDDQPQTITSFEKPAEHAIAATKVIDSTTALDRVAADAPVNIVVLDEANTLFQDMSFARYSLKKYLDAQPDKLTQPTMLMAVDLQQFQLLRDYTQNKEDIQTALDHHLVTYPWRTESGSWKPQQFASALAALMQVAEATAGHPGHKNLIWIGRGFPSIRLDEMQPADAAKLAATIEQCIDMLRDSRITLYTVDPAGLSGETTTDEDGFDTDDPFGGDVEFNTIASATGGKAFHGRNDVDAEIATSVRDGASFYTLSYKPESNPTKGPFHKIRVILKNPALHATARTGYYTSPVSNSDAAYGSTIEDRTAFDIVTAANNTMIYDGVPITLSRVPANSPEIIVHVAPNALTWTSPGPNEERTTQIQLLFSTYDRKGNLIERTSKSVAALAPALNESKIDERRGAALEIHLSPKDASAVRLRVVVRIPGSGKVGTANLDLSAK